jgi:hypothetical protein
MTVWSDNMPGWFKRRQAEGGETAPAASSTAGENGGPADESATTASVTTGGGSSQEPVVVYEAANLMEAQVVKGRLESEGIPAFVRSEALGVIYGLTAGSLARADVLVPGPLAEKAVEILFADELPGDAPDESA